MSSSFVYRVVVLLCVCLILEGIVTKRESTDVLSSVHFDFMILLLTLLLTAFTQLHRYASFLDFLEEPKTPKKPANNVTLKISCMYKYGIP